MKKRIKIRNIYYIDVTPIKTLITAFLNYLAISRSNREIKNVNIYEEAVDIKKISL